MIRPKAPNIIPLTNTELSSSETKKSAKVNPKKPGGVI